MNNVSNVCDEPAGHYILQKLGAFGLITVLVGLPVNELFGYFILVIGAVIIFNAEVASRIWSWALAVSLVASVVVAQVLLRSPGIEEGHNVFLGDDPNGVMRNGLPADVFQSLSDRFDKQYPVDRRCEANKLRCWRGDGAVLRFISPPGVQPSLFASFRHCDPDAIECWRGYKFPDQVFAFSADGIFQKPLYSRRVSKINFVDPSWLHLGFTNDGAYDWDPQASDVVRVIRGRSWLIFNDRSQLVMPWFVMYRFPEAHIGSRLCWTGNLIWERREEHFEVIHHPSEQCRTLIADDINSRIFGDAVVPKTLAIRLIPNRVVWLSQIATTGLTAIAALAVLCLLVRHSFAKTILPLLLMAASLLVVALIDVTMIGGLRTHLGLEDAHFFDAVGRLILQSALAGDFKEAMRGAESVYFYTPGFRYFRALEKLIFGDTTLGYLSIILLLPIVAHGFFRRFLSRLWALGLVLIFVLTPIGAFFGSSFFLYAKYAIQGFGDPAAYTFFLGGLLLIVGRTRDRQPNRLGAAMGAALLLALAVFIRPQLVPATAIVLGGAAVVSLQRRHWWRLLGLCAGFLPVLWMPLHNWIFGGVFVPLTATATFPSLVTMSPSGYGQAFWELATLNFSGGRFLQALEQIAGWLSGFLGGLEYTGRLGQLSSIPFHAVAVAVLVYVAFSGPQFDLWLKIVARATLGQHCFALFYIASARYYMLTWFLSMLVLFAWLENRYSRKVEPISRRV